MNSHILVVEDEPRLAEILADYLLQAGFQAHTLLNGSEVLPWMARHPVDLLLLDIMLPGIDGMELVQQIRLSSQVPILFTTARVDESDRLRGLMLGADDYICKPYSPREVVARVQAVLRRSRTSLVPPTALLTLDDSRHQLTLAGKTVQLTVVEFRLLEIMQRSPGKIFSRQQLMSSIYSDGRVVSERTVDSHIKKLRRKLDAIGGSALIEAVYGLGYRLSDELERLEDEGL